MNARVRDLGLAPGRLPPGVLNALTDVPCVRVGHVTLVSGDSIRTGVTAIVPDAVDRASGSLAAGLFVGNGYGKLVGSTQLAELGVIETPIVLTGTLSVFRAADALVTYMMRRPGNSGLLSVNPVAGETNDGFLSDIRARPVTEEHVLTALSSAVGGPLPQGCVGAGTGTAALGFKGGIGTSSRIVAGPGASAGVVGVLVQSNFSGTLAVRGIPIEPPAASSSAAPGSAVPGSAVPGDSCMIIVAVDRALDSRQLTRVAKRAVFAMGLVGSDFAPHSGDYAIAFATGEGAPVSDSLLGPLFSATAEAVAEALLDSLFLATTTVGYQGHVKHAVRADLVVRACREAGVA